ncbi:MAG: hypothetical protein JRD49_01175 [Deltaproteobacteria bacterium]|nr:hypothetical protein [Deltaproteobacteria bacterium]MBW2610800.1 hypothetical protein [Deltaproteobacteria bacterium]MBW2676151.1 hypothetical protein [Deltaproteobacteria bacterium]
MKFKPFLDAECQALYAGTWFPGKHTGLPLPVSGLTLSSGTHKGRPYNGLCSPAADHKPQAIWHQDRAEALDYFAR